MKTAPRNPGKANFGRAILLVALAVALGSTGCQKEDELMPSVNKSLTQSEANTQRSLPLLDESAPGFNNGDLAAAITYDVIKIDHQAAKSHQPDYVVYVRSDGMVIYDGHRNVRVEGVVSFRISDATMPMLKEIFNQYSFYSIVPDFPIYADMPLVFTTFQPTQLIKPRTIYDNCSDDPKKLILIRRSVENLLGIAKYVNTPVQNVPANEQVPLF